MIKQILTVIIICILISTGCKKSTSFTTGATVTSLNCSSATFSGTFTNGTIAGIDPINMTIADNILITIPYTGGNGANYSAISISSTGVTGLTATASPDSVNNGDGNLVLTVNGEPTNFGNANFLLNFGGQSCTVSAKVNKKEQAVVSILACGNATKTGRIKMGVNAVNIPLSIPYNGGNGGTYKAINISSYGINGLTATASAGSIVEGNGYLNLLINGTPEPSNFEGAKFLLNFGGQSCEVSVGVEKPSPPNPCLSNVASVVNVTSPITGKIWMDRNLGASRAATSSTDLESFGDLYQWGRSSDGHQCRTSNTTTTISSIDKPVHNEFILVQFSPWNWRSPQNINLWQGLNGTNNPCPSGYRLPRATEFDAEQLSWVINNSAFAFASPLKLPAAGYRDGRDGSITDVGNVGCYWSSSVSGLSFSSDLLYFNSNNAKIDDIPRAYGLSVRCIKD
jgi:uncharacterized protein (TIGR02145 family)